MAQLTISRFFSAIHGTFSRQTTRYELQVMVRGNIVLGFTNHCDSVLLESKLEAVCAALEGHYLDELMGRATHEMIALWVFQHIDVAVDSVTVSGDRITTMVERPDFLRHAFSSVMFQQKGTTAFLRGELSSAETLFSKAIAQDPSNEEAYMLRGRVFRYMGKYERAIEDFREVLQLMPQWSEGYRNMGNMLMFLNRYEDMLPYFIRATQLAPFSSLALNNLGYAFGCMQRWEEARQYSLRAVDLAPQNYEAHLDLANACEKLHLPEEAAHYREIATHLKEHLPNDNAQRYQIADEEDSLMRSVTLISSGSTSISTPNIE